MGTTDPTVRSLRIFPVNKGFQFSEKPEIFFWPLTLQQLEAVHWTLKSRETYEKRDENDDSGSDCDSCIASLSENRQISAQRDSTACQYERQKNCGFRSYCQ